MKAYVYTFSLALAWMLSPESLVLLGQLLGSTGGVGIPMLLAFIVSSLTVVLIYSSHLSSGKGSALLLMAQEFGWFPTLSVVLASRVTLLLMAACGMLVTAGFAFNEIFIFWFPNFAFATILLMAIAVINMLREKWIQTVQILLVAIVVVGMVSLSLLGVLGDGGEHVVNVNPAGQSYVMAVSFLLLFLGYDLGSGDRKRVSIQASFTALVLAFVVFALWGFVSLKYVAVERLVVSTIPHLLVARHLGGHFGRLVMGVVVIAGACAAVNALLVVVRSTLSQLAENRMVPLAFVSFWRGRLVPVIFAVAVLVLMFTGVAGEESFEPTREAMLLVNILQIGLHSFAVTRTLQKQGGRKVAHGFIVSTVFFGVSLTLLFESENFRELLEFCLSILFTASAYAFAWIAYNRKQ